MIRRWLMAATVALAGCAPVPEAASVSYRDSAARISSTLRFDLVRFQGDWVVRASYPTDVLQRVTIRAVSETRFIWRADGRESQGEVTGPGRFRLEGASEEYWVLWVDEGFRTAAIGTPDGQLWADPWIASRAGGLTAWWRRGRCSTLMAMT